MGPALSPLPRGWFPGAPRWTYASGANRISAPMETPRSGHTYTRGKFWENFLLQRKWVRTTGNAKILCMIRKWWMVPCHWSDRDAVRTSAGEPRSESLTSTTTRALTTFARGFSPWRRGRPGPPSSGSRAQRERFLPGRASRPPAGALRSHRGHCLRSRREFETCRLER